jgi:D-alanyl-D-alanine carboxypeptidase/D-alanyl-D-alanine-endopeptidase (penicillin-binding protein 4)
MRALMNKSLILGVTLLALGHSTAGATGEEHRKWLDNKLQKLAADKRIAPARVGVVVRGVRSGKYLVRIRPAEQFNVASCAKLVTSSTALATLGPEYRFKTVLYAVRKGKKQPLGPGLGGDLYLKGFGDPTLSEQDLWRMARDLHDRGIRRVEGRVIIDESFFDGHRLAPLYDSKNTDAWYRPPNGAISINGNVVTVLVRAGTSSGSLATVLLDPRSSYLKLFNKTTTVSRRRRSWVGVSTGVAGRNTAVTVKGRVRLGYRGRPFRRRIEDPGLLAGHTLLDVLARQGIQVARPKVSRGKVPDKAWPLVSHDSGPLAVIVRRMNKRSDNFIAEQVLKVLGAEVHGEPGTWDNGLKVTGGQLAKLGIKPGSYVMKNGSGLYDATRFTPQQIVQVLREAHLNFRSGADFVSSLALAGVDGTLAHRLIGGGAERYVRAKTGTLSGVVALSGYAGTSRRRGPLAFSILINELPQGKTLEARAVADEMAEAMVNYLER